MLRNLHQRIFLVLVASRLLVDITNCMVIDCEYSDVIWAIDTFYTCVGNVKVDGDAKQLTYVSQNHEEGRDNNDVKAVMIYDHNLQFAPRNIQRFFPNLEAFSLFNNTIAELTQECLRGLHHLRYFNFLYNQIEIVESYLFIENPLLEWIDFGYNPIRHVAHNAFEHLHFLQILNFTLTTCINHSGVNSSSVELLKFQLVVNCPPTFEMTETKVINGMELRNEIGRQITVRIDPITKMLLEMEERLERLEGARNNEN